jgi:hypothetical protein
MGSKTTAIVSRSRRFRDGFHALISSSDSPSDGVVAA